MNRPFHPARSAVCALLALTAALAGAATLTAAGAASSPASTAGPAEDAVQRRYERDRAACLSGRTPQDQATCLREAGAARDEARRGGLSSEAAQRHHNRMARCEPLPAADREACRARMAGAGTTSGSVAEGAISRELVTREVPVLPANPPTNPPTNPPATPPPSTPAR